MRNTKNKIIKNLYLLKPRRLFLINNDPPINLISFLKGLFSVFINYSELIKIVRHKSGIDNLFFVKSGRLAIYLFLKGINIKANDEVIVSSYNCLVVPEAVILAGAKPIYVDNIRFDSMDLFDLTKKINSKTRCIIVPVMDGLEGNLRDVIKISKDNKIYLLIDAAHTSILPKRKNLREFYNNADAIIQSFSHSKIFSLKSGGLLYVKNDDLFKKIGIFYDNLKQPSAIRELMKFYSLFLSRLLGSIAYLNILYRVFDKIFVESEIAKDEYEGEPSKYFFEKMGRLKIGMLIEAINNFEKWDQKRIYYYKYYTQKLNKLPIHLIYDGAISFAPLHFPILVENADRLYKFLQKKSIYVERWFFPILYPDGFSDKKFHFDKKSFPKSVQISNKVLNLPTSPRLSEKQISTIIENIIQFYN